MSIRRFSNPFLMLLRRGVSGFGVQGSGKIRKESDV